MRARSVIQRRRLLVIVNITLDVSQLEAGKMALRKPRWIWRLC
jgi:hypothetical protein